MRFKRRSRNTFFSLKPKLAKGFSELTKSNSSRSL
jgi:hypothetical protein